MELLQLQYFVTVAKYENVSRAADDLYVSQPALSSAIIRLEKELGAPLFDRNGRKIFLNTYGRYFLNTARKILDLVSTSKFPVANGNAISEKISIAFQGYDSFIWRLVREFMRDNPNVCFNIYGNSLNNPFADSNYDFIVGKSAVPGRNCIPCRSGQLYAVIPKTNPLSEKVTLAIANLRNEKFCCLRNEQGDFEREYLLCIENGFVPQCVMVTNNPLYKLQALADGFACGLIPIGWKDFYSNSSKVKVIPVENTFSAKESFLYWSDSVYSSLAAQKFLNFLKTNICAEN